LADAARVQVRSAATRGRRRDARFSPERLLLALPLLFVAVLFLYPLANSVGSSLGGPEPFAYYRDAFGNEVFVRAALRTLLVSALCTAISLLLAYPLAYEITRPRNRIRTLILAIVVITFWISVLIRAYSWVAILEPGGVLNDTLRSLGVITEPLEFQGNIWGVTIGMTHFLLPYMVLVLIPSLRSVQPELVAAARSLGANRRRAFMRVTLPMTAGGIAAGCLLTFILSVGFFVMPAILAGPAVPFVANIIGQQVGKFQEFEVAAAMGVSLTVVIVGLYLILLRFVDPTKMLGGGDRS
jgi:ABC-type spermidine/putrescine transport system permease subunit I